MVKLLKTTVRWGGSMFAAACLAAAWGAAGQPGTVNYVEGSVSLDGRPVAVQNTGGATQMAPGDVLQTGGNGRAELLLTPGAFLRLGENGAVKLLSPSLTNTQVELQQGEVNLEVDLLAPQNHLDVIAHGADIHIAKRGIYSIGTNPPMVAVYDGQAQVQLGNRTAEAGKGRELALAPAGKLKARKFDRKQGDNLYAWSQLRSGYLAEANASTAQMVVAGNYPAWWAGTGWYWNPYYSTWAFVPGMGYFDNPWGFGFYSPAFWGYYGMPYYGGFGYGRVGRGFGYAPGVGVGPRFGGGVGPHFGGGMGFGRGFGGRR